MPLGESSNSLEISVRNVSWWANAGFGELPTFLEDVQDLTAVGAKAIVRCTSFAVSPAGVEFHLFAAVAGEGQPIIDRRAPRVPGPDNDGEELSLWVTDPEPRAVRILSSGRTRVFAEDGSEAERWNHVVKLFFELELDNIGADVVLHLRWQPLGTEETRLRIPASSLRAAAQSMRATAQSLRAAADG